MNSNLIIDMLKSGAIAFTGGIIVRALGEKDMSQIMMGTGWAIIGVDLVEFLVPVFKGLQQFLYKWDQSLQYLNKIIHLGGH